MSLVLLPFWAPDMVPRDTDKLCRSFLSQGQVWVTPRPDSHPEWNSSRSALQPVYLLRLKLAWAHAAIFPWNQLIFHSTFGHTLAKYWAEWNSCWKHPICQGVCEHLVQCGCPASVACQLPVPQDTQVNQSQTCARALQIPAHTALGQDTRSEGGVCPDEGQALGSLPAWVCVSVPPFRAAWHLSSLCLCFLIYKVRLKIIKIIVL